MARNVLVLILTGIGVFIGEVSQYSSYKKEVTVTEAVSKVSQTFLLSRNFSIMAMFLTSPKNSRNELRTYM